MTPATLQVTGVEEAVQHLLRRSGSGRPLARARAAQFVLLLLTSLVLSFGAWTGLRQQLQRRDVHDELAAVAKDSVLVPVLCSRPGGTGGGIRCLSSRKQAAVQPASPLRVTTVVLAVIGSSFVLCLTVAAMVKLFKALRSRESISEIMQSYSSAYSALQACEL